MAYDTLVLGGTLCTHDQTFAGDLAITEGKVAAIARPGELRAGDAKRVVDARGCFVMPGFIEILDMSEADASEADPDPDVFDHGVLTSLRLITPKPDQSLRAAHFEAEAARKSLGLAVPCRDEGWHLTITGQEHIAEVGSLADLGVTSFAFFERTLCESWHREIVPVAHKHRVTLMTVSLENGQDAATTHQALKAADHLMVDCPYVLAIRFAGHSQWCSAARYGRVDALRMILRFGALPGDPADWRTHEHRHTRSLPADVASFASVPAQHLGLWCRKGGLLPGFDADLLVVDAADFTIRHALLRGQLIPRTPTKANPAPAGIWLHRARLG